MRRREVLRSSEAPPVELERFRQADWIDLDELLPDGACPHLKHTGADHARECERINRSVRAFRRYLDARHAWADENGRDYLETFRPGWRQERTAQISAPTAESRHP